MNFDGLTAKKHRLDQARPLPRALERNLDDWYRVELTFTSNALEGNTLTRRETALVVEKGLTVGGKTLVEHLEAANHAAALDFARARARTMVELGRKADEAGAETGIEAADVLRIHELILRGIDDENAGRYRSVAVRLSGSSVVLPNPVKVPALMEAFFFWLAREWQGRSRNEHEHEHDGGTTPRHPQEPVLHPVELAAEAHYRLVTMHPFVDGNGRTARLLMNLILSMAGYPAAIIRKRDRLAYIAALEKAQLGGSKQPYLKLIAAAVDRSLKIYLNALAGEGASEDEEGDDGLSDATSNIRVKEETAGVRLLKIGELAKRVGEPNSTIRHWSKEGLLEVAKVSPSGYHYYSPAMVGRVHRILELQAKRLTLAEIRGELGDS